MRIFVGLLCLVATVGLAEVKIANEDELAIFAKADGGSAVVTERIVLTRDHQLGRDHHLGVSYGAGFDGSGGGHLELDGTLACIPTEADYCIVTNYVVGNYKADPGDVTPVVLPTLYGRFNRGRRDVSMWNGPAMGQNATRAIRAAINAMPSRYSGEWTAQAALRNDRAGTLYLPGGSYRLSEPIPWSAGMAIVGESHNMGIRAWLAPTADFPPGRYMIESLQCGRWKAGRPNMTGTANFFSEICNISLSGRYGARDDESSYVANGILHSQSLGTHVHRILIADFRDTGLRVTKSDAGRFSDMRISTRRSGHTQTGILLEDGPLYTLLFENITANALHRGFVVDSKTKGELQGGIVVNGLHNENTGVPILLVNPMNIEMRGLYLLDDHGTNTTFAARIVDDGQSEVVLSGVTRRGLNHIEVVRGGKTNLWSLGTASDEPDPAALPNWQGMSRSRPFIFNLRQEYGQ